MNLDFGFFTWKLVQSFILKGLAFSVELTLIAPGGIRAAITQMIPDFERKTGNTVKATFGSGGGTKAQVVKGDAFDVPIVQVPYEDVIKSGHVVVASETPLANVSVGLAVRTGAPKPDISTADAVKKLLLGTPADEVFKLDAMANADSVAWFSAFARRRAAP